MATVSFMIQRVLIPPRPDLLNPSNPILNANTNLLMEQCLLKKNCELPPLNHWFLSHTFPYEHASPYDPIEGYDIPVDMGTMKVFPPELLGEIFSHLDMAGWVGMYLACQSFQPVLESVQGAKLITDIPQLFPLLNAIHRAHASFYITPKRLLEVLLSTKCARCDSIGDILNLFTAERVCLECHIRPVNATENTDPNEYILLLSEAAKFVSIPIDNARNMEIPGPKLRLTPGHYGILQLNNRWQERLVLWSDFLRGHLKSRNFEPGEIKAAFDALAPLRPRIMGMDMMSLMCYHAGVTVSKFKVQYRILRQAGIMPAYNTSLDLKRLQKVILREMSAVHIPFFLEKSPISGCTVIDCGCTEGQHAANMHLTRMFYCPVCPDDPIASTTNPFGRESTPAKGYLTREALIEHLYKCVSTHAASSEQQWFRELKRAEEAAARQLEEEAMRAEINNAAGNSASAGNKPRKRARSESSLDSRIWSGVGPSANATANSDGGGN